MSRIIGALGARLAAAWAALRRPQLVHDGRCLDELANELAFMGRLVVLSGRYEDGDIATITIHHLDHQLHYALEREIGSR
jgi:hypothetical protein